MTSYTIAHFSDAHLPLLGGFHAAELCGKRALSALNWARSRRRRHRRAVADALRADILTFRPDHVAMTGDVVNFGLEREFAAAADWLGSFGAADDLSFVPGNHEALIGGAAAARDTAFAAFIAGDEPIAANASYPWLRRRGPVALIGVSTAVATPPGFAQGEVGAAQIAALRRHLRAARGLCRIVLIHHPPTALSRPRKALRDRAALVGALAEEGAELALHGHNHKSELSWIDGDAGRIPVLGVPSASTPAGIGPEAAEWRLLTVTETPGGHDVGILRRALTLGGFTDRGRFRLSAPR
ncbi:MAG: metallophosphoesterase [Paracoccaceae bacterium]